MPEQTRLHVVFSADFHDATVTAEIWNGSQRIACHVGPLELVEGCPLLTEALTRVAEYLPRLF